MIYDFLNHRIAVGFHRVDYSTKIYLNISLSAIIDLFMRFVKSEIFFVKICFIG